MILRDFYKTVTKKNNRKSHVKFHCFYPLHLVVLIKQKYLSLVTRQNHTLNLERIITPQFQNALRMKLANALLIHGTKSALEKFGEKIS